MQPKRIQCLDGLRAVSIILVLIGHASFSLPLFISNSFLFPYFSNGHLGVNIFFLISGYLITKLLIDEEKNTGEINIKNFYIRRIFRIFPVFYLYLIVLILLKLTIYKTIFTDFKSIYISATYLWNYKHLFSELLSYYDEENGNWFMGHLWSLSLEEQFYLIWPLVFKYVNSRKLSRYLIYIILFTPIIRLLTYVFLPNSRGQLDMMLFSGSDSILIGCLTAIIEINTIKMKSLNEMYKKKWPILFAIIFILVINKNLEIQFKGSYSVLIGHTLMNIFIALILLWVVKTKNKIILLLLNNKGMIHIGLISYSLYIWQQLFLQNFISNKFNTFPLNLILVFLVAETSYYFFENPINKLKYKLI